MGTINTILRKNKLNSQGLAPVVVELYDDRSGKRKQKSTGIRIALKDWDDKKRRVRPSHPNSTRINNRIDKVRDQLSAILLDIQAEKLELSQKRLDAAYEDGGNLCFFEWSRNVYADMDKERGYAKASKVSSGLLHLKYYLQHLKDEEQAAMDRGESVSSQWRRKESFVFADFNEAFLEDLYAFLRNEKGLSPSTVFGGNIGNRRVFKDAIKRKAVAKKYWPFDGVKLPQSKGKIHFLEENQLVELASLEFKSGSKEELYRDMYLFCAYGGGMRWADVAQLRRARIQNGKLRITTGKTQTPVSFPLPDKAKEILEKYTSPENKPSDYVFPALDPEKMQGNLKLQRNQLMAKNTAARTVLNKMGVQLGLDFRLGFHTSRHTFATMAVNHGMPITTLKLILGHSAITTTMIYLHITGKNVEEGMENFNQALQKDSAPKVSPSPQPIRQIGPMADFIRRYIESTASEIGVELTQVDGLALEMYEAMQQLPKESQQTIPVRIEAQGDLSAFEQTLTARSLFGEAVRFVVQAA